MKKILIASILVIWCFAHMASAEPWNHVYFTGDYSQQFKFSAVSSTADGGLIAAGENVVLKLDAQGGIQWSRLFPSYYPNNYFITVVKQTREGGYILAAHTGYVYRESGVKIVKLDSSGKRVWLSEIPAPGEFLFYLVYALEQTPDGGYIFAGYVDVSEPASAVWQDRDQTDGLIIVKLGGHGQAQWKKRLNVGSATSIVVKEDGGFLLATTAGSLVSLDKSGKVIWQKKYGKNVSLVASRAVDGGYLCAGYVLRNFPFYDGVILKVDTTGNIQWQEKYSGGGPQFFNAIAPAGDGYVIAGETGRYGMKSPLVVKINRTGQIIWQKNYGFGYQNQTGNAIADTQDGGFALASNGGWLLKLDSEGKAPGFCTAIRTAQGRIKPLSLVAETHVPEIRTLTAPVRRSQTNPPNAVETILPDFCDVVVLDQHYIYFRNEGNTLRIFGYNFGRSSSGASVMLGNLALPINTWSDNFITALVPNEATSGQLIVHVGSKVSNAVPVQVLDTQ